ncbi:MAG: tol-pal system YbgF family protein, partial [bacterium]
GGIETKRFHVNYAFVPYGELGNLQRFTLSYKFGTIRNTEHGRLPRPEVDLDKTGPLPNVRDVPPPGERKQPPKKGSTGDTPPQIRGKKTTPDTPDTTGSTISIDVSAPPKKTKKADTEEGLELVSPEDLSEWKSSYELGKQQYLKGNYLEALHFFSEVLKSKPNHLKSLIWLGLTEYKLGKVKQARRRLRKVLILDPDNAIAKKNLERMQ